MKEFLPFVAAAAGLEAGMELLQEGLAVLVAVVVAVQYILELFGEIALPFLSPNRRMTTEYFNLAVLQLYLLYCSFLTSQQKLWRKN